VHERLVREGRVSRRVREISDSHLCASLFYLVAELLVDVTQVSGQMLEVVRISLAWHAAWWLRLLLKLVGRCVIVFGQD
jgi:hypothetical protein